MSALRVIDFILDFFFPVSRGTEQLQPVRVAVLSGNVLTLKECIAEHDKLLDRESARRQGTEARLTTILGLSSIAGSIVYGGIVAQAAGTLHVETPLLRWLVGFGSLYLAVQICSAILSALRGLSRRSYLALTREDVLPSQGETETDYISRRLAAEAEVLADHQTNNNAKITEMAKAHRAMQNFIWALLLLAILGAASAVRKSPDNGLVEKLRKDQELRELLRGPQGPAGPTGPQGPRGPVVRSGSSKGKHNRCTCNSLGKKSGRTKH